MKPLASLLFLSLFFSVNSNGQGKQMLKAANQFIHTLDSSQKLKALYPFDIDERFNFHFFPKDDRKGISLNELSVAQRKAAFDLLKACLSKRGIEKLKTILSLELVLKELEHRKPEDHYRDPGKYYITIFGTPGATNIWGWRFEGHHITFNFSADKNELVSGTPGFFGSNPAIVQDGPQKNTQVLKEEADMAFELLHSLTSDQLKKAVMDTLAPNEIITFINRKAMLENPGGILYSEMIAKQKELFLQLIRVYIHRYTRLFADKMLKEIQEAGFDNLHFTWAGFTNPQLGKAHYYRIQGPTIIIEYDNSQNNANHVHSVMRDLKNDFGGDLLMEHYKASHQ